MLKISKAASHKGLDEWKARFKASHRQTATYDDLWENHDFHLTVKKDLIHEQKGLCCYCCCQLDENDSHIEHFFPQSKYPQMDLDYSNLFVSCNGGRKKASCGNKKEDIDPKGAVISPTDENCGAAFSYTLRGKIEAIDGYVLAQSTIDILSLNNPALVKARDVALWESGVPMAAENERGELVAELASDPDILPAYCNILQFFANPENV